MDGSAKLLANITAESCVEDVAAVAGKGKNVHYTHFQGDSHACLDRIYVSAELVPLCNEYKVQEVSFSDHCLVAISLGSKTKQKQKFNYALRKMNTKLLEDKEFVKSVEDYLEKHYGRECNSKSEAWESFKQKIKIIALERSSTIRKSET